MSHVYSAYRSQKKASDPLGVELNSSCEPPGEGAGNQT